MRKKQRQIIEMKKEAFNQGYEKGWKQGHEVGFDEAMTKDRKGMHMTQYGLYRFKDGSKEAVLSHVVTDDKS